MSTTTSICTCRFCGNPTVYVYVPDGSKEDDRYSFVCANQSCPVAVMIDAESEQAAIAAYNGDKQPRASGQPDPASPNDLRDIGWTVAVHNDYRLNGVAHTFWLMVKGKTALKGEAKTDAEALDQIRAQVKALQDVAS